MSLLLLLGGSGVPAVTSTSLFLDAVRIEGQFTPGVWESFGCDVVIAPGISGSRGIQANGPLDRVASTGLLNFTLRNDAGNTGGTLGWYSPASASVRSGFVAGMPIRVVVVYRGTDYPLWRGKLRTINPDAGQYKSRRVHCTAQDCMGDLAQADVRSITPQLNQTEVDLLESVMSALPATARPWATDFDAPLDVFPYAFDTISGGVKAMSALRDVIVSSLGYLYPTRDGTLRYENRYHRPGQAVSYAFTDAVLVGLAVPDSLDQVFNRVRVTYHQKTIDPAATTVLYAETSHPAVAPGQTVTLWGSYRDPTNTLKLIGGTDFVTPVAGTDYLANTLEDGSGSDMTAFVSVTAYGFAADVKFELSNTGTQTAYVTTLQLRGRGIYDNAPSTVESYTAQAYGDRPLDVDLPFQDNANVSQDLADYLLAAYDTLGEQVDEIAVPVGIGRALA